MDDTPGSWVWGLFSNRGRITFDRTFTQPHPRGLYHRHFPPTYVWSPTEHWWERAGFYGSQGDGYFSLTAPCWFLVLLSAPLPLWRAGRWAAAPWRRKVRGFDVQPIASERQG
jgi:hypothetical protein